MNQNLVQLAIFPDSIGAYLAKSKLESEGIEAFVVDEYVNRLYSSGIIQVKVKVWESDQERAREILAEDSGEALISTLTENSEPLDNVTYLRRKKTGMMGFFRNLVKFFGA